jgi:hypothetical protein
MNRTDGEIAVSAPCSNDDLNDDLAGFRFHVAWCPEDETYVATVAEYPLLSWVGDTRLDALCGLERLVERVLDGQQRNHESAPDHADAPR